MTNGSLEPIKSALVMGDHARARRLRTELIRAELECALGMMLDPLNFIDGSPVFYVQRVESALDQLDALCIPEES